MITTLAERLKQARSMAGLTQQSLTNAICNLGDKKISRGAIAQWESGITKEIEASNLLKATQVLDVRPEWLQFGTGSMRPGFPDNTTSNISNMLFVPILDDTQATNYMIPKNIDTFIGLDQELAKIASSNSFGINITNNSMLPEFKNGDIIIIDPSVKPQPGEIVAAKLMHKENIIVRKYCPLTSVGTDLDSFNLSPLNKDWPTVTINNQDQGHIIGTLIEHRCQRRIY